MAKGIVPSVLNGKARLAKHALATSCLNLSQLQPEDKAAYVSDQCFESPRRTKCIHPSATYVVQLRRKVQKPGQTPRAEIGPLVSLLALFLSSIK